MRDFSLDMYSWFLGEILNLGYTPLTVADWCEGKRPLRYVVMRHDVDRFPEYALRMAQLERNMGVAATYYFRAKRKIFVPAIIHEIENLGHEIGYHYEVLAEARGDIYKARALFAGHMQTFRTHCNVRTAAMHGCPLSPYTETAFWQQATLEEFNLLGEAYISFAHEPIPYFTDTGRTWNDTASNLRDRLTTEQSDAFVQHNIVNKMSSTPEFLCYLRQYAPSAFYVSFHSERWPSGCVGFGVSWLMDMACNGIKRIVKKYRGLYTDLA